MTEHWPLLLDRGAVPVALLDILGRCVHVNEALCHALGRSLVVRCTVGSMTSSEATIRRTVPTPKTPQGRAGMAP